MILRLTLGRQTLERGEPQDPRRHLDPPRRRIRIGPGGAADDARTTRRNERASAAATGATALAGRLGPRGPNARRPRGTSPRWACSPRSAPTRRSCWPTGHRGARSSPPPRPASPSSSPPSSRSRPANAEIAVTLNPAVTITGASTFFGLTDTPAAAASQFLRVNSAADALLGLSAAQLVAALPAATAASRGTIQLRDIPRTALASATGSAIVEIPAWRLSDAGGNPGRGVRTSTIVDDTGVHL